MEQLQELVRTVMEGANGPWPVIALAVLGGYIILWKFGNQIITLLQKNQAVTEAAHAEAKNISDSIITNHGSKNLGDAIDRLTENVGTIKTYVEGLDARLTHLEDVEQE